MNQPLAALLNDTEVSQTIERFVATADAGDHDTAWSMLAPLLAAQPHQEFVAIRLVEVVERGHLSVARALEVLTAVHAAHSESEHILGLLGEAMERAHEINFLNAPPPDDPLFATVMHKLSELAERRRGDTSEPQLLIGLFTVARLLARQHDDITERAARRRIELDPDHSGAHYDYGLFLKTRGRFREGMLENDKAAHLAGEWVESYEWNLGICATGAREGAIALDVWLRMKQKIAMGRFDLPEGRYGQVKVRLAERPLAKRTAQDDDPGLEETIWIERLSPCHGVVRSVLLQSLGVDYGDVVLFDGAPITYHKYGEDEIPVFPHLTTLVRSRYRIFDFAGTQDAAGRIADVTNDLPNEALVYPHSENFVVLCAGCWQDETINHEHGPTDKKRVVTGKIAGPPDLHPAELLRLIDAAIAQREPCRIYSPDLCEAAGLSNRANVERRRFALLSEN